MIRILILLLATLVSNNAISADNGERITNLKQLCISDKGTGFNWKNGSWEQVTFVEKRFVVSKVHISKEENELQAVLSCNENTFRMSEEEFSFGDIVRKYYNSCLKLQEFGEKYATYLPCTETHSRKGNSWEDVTFTCASSQEMFHMRGGHFHTGRIHGGLSPNPKDDYKDSLSIFVGKCANISD